MDAILESLPDDRAMYSRDLVEDVSQLSGKRVSPVTIGHHMSMLEDEGSVRRVGPERRTKWRKTWRGGSRSNE